METSTPAEQVLSLSYNDVGFGTTPPRTGGQVDYLTIPLDVWLVLTTGSSYVKVTGSAPVWAILITVSNKQHRHIAHRSAQSDLLCTLLLAA